MSKKKYLDEERDSDEKLNYIKRLNRVEGQVRGISKMIVDDRYCEDVLIQIAAINKALKSLGQEMLSNHMRTCMCEEIKNGHDESIDEVMNLFRKLV